MLPKDHRPSVVVCRLIPRDSKTLNSGTYLKPLKATYYNLKVYSKLWGFGVSGYGSLETLLFEGLARHTLPVC